MADIDTTPTDPTPDGDGRTSRGDRPQSSRSNYGRDGGVGDSFYRNRESRASGASDYGASDYDRGSAARSAGGQSRPRDNEPRRSGTPRPDPRSIAASQALVTSRRPSYRDADDRYRSDSRDDYRYGRSATSGRADNRRSSADYRSSYRSDYRNDYGGGSRGGNGRGGNGGGQPPFVETDRNKKRNRNISIVIAVALVSLFIGFAMRDFYVADGGFDDERPIQAEQVPTNLREFCVTYNGLPSFTLVTAVTTSALTATSVPILKLDTCSIPVRETANALQELGIEQRRTSIGLQLGGSNLTLVNLPAAGSLAGQLFERYPSLAESLAGRNRAEKIETLKGVLNSMQGNIGGLATQNMIETNKPNVWAITPGHTFQLQPQIQRPAEVE